MYIKSMVIDGFKSYAQRTEIIGFDNLFNAITGLNGSGKSNILDAICFLLGISNMSQVRASNLQELVYKSGQAGVSKATVSITFDNNDKKNSPLGYEQYDEFTVSRQVVIGGRNKYSINGSNANNTRVQDLFRSVQLNVNNPHFLIMQGRITKVLNMKPLEILSMIEEAAGTKLYESKKEAALKTIEKKNAKLGEIDTILKEEITPKLNKLKDERSSYLSYQKVMRELEHLNKLYIAYRFISAEDTRKKCSDELGEMQQLIDGVKEAISQTNEKIEELDECIAELERKRDEESGSVMGEREEELKEREKEDAKCQSVVDNKKQAIKAEQKCLKEVNKNITDDKKALTGKEKEMRQLSEEWSGMQEESKTDHAANVEAQKHYQAVSSGLSSNTDGEDATLNEQLMASKNEISKAETEIKQSQMRLKHEQDDLMKREAELKKTEQQYKKDRSAHDALQTGINKIQAEMKKLNYEDGKEEKLVDERRTVLKEMQQLRSNLDGLESRYSQLRFEYDDPEAKFDRSKVHGLVAKLVEVKKPEAATALEVAAGSKLYNIVVDSEVTGKKLLQKGNLQRRYTIIPLNKISGRSIDAATLQRAQSLVGKENVFTALSLVNYDKQLQPAMEFVFGSTFVCRDMNSAKTVAFHEGVMKRCVTLEGDIFDPSGTLTGGSRPQTNAILLKVKEFREIENQYKMKEEQTTKLAREVAGIKSVADKYNDLKHQLDLKDHEAALMKASLEQGTHHLQLEEITRIQADIAAQTETVKAAEETQKRFKEKVKELENKIKNAGAIREKELKEAEARVKGCKKKMEESERKMKEKQQVMDSLKLESEELGKAVCSYEEQLKVIEKTLGEYDEKMNELNEAATQTQMRVKEAKAELEKQKQLLKLCNKDIGTKVNEKKHLETDVKKSHLKIQETDHKINKHKKDSKEAARQVEELLKKYEWIADEKKYFGQTNTAYDFEANDPKEAGKRIQQLQETKDKLEKSVNMRAMNMLGNAEEQFNDLIKKRKIVQNDKSKIAAVIQELDEKKNEALKKAWIQVNKDFGSIFSTLLPGTQAKLDPPEGETVLAGLEVKVAFGDVWKESLSELSGGQRSLVALSLILAMLLFKPAPIYILDEVDAALDLSHTQNIGQMIKTHFKQSQFIVVSLKDGMFNNANVLYKTKFVDGVSTVTRHSLLAHKTPHHNKENIPTTAGNKEKQRTTKRTRLEESVNNIA